MVAKTRISLEEYEALPDDGIERWVIDGILHEGDDMSQRNRHHSKTMGKVGQYLNEWNDRQTEHRGHVLVGDAGFILDNDPLLSFGIDAAFVSAEVWGVQNDDESTMIRGIPRLAVEISSPSTTIEKMNEKIRAFLAHGVPLVWVLDPYWKVVDIYRPNEKKTTLNTDHTLTADGVLPGFTLPVAKLFE